MLRILAMSVVWAVLAMAQRPAFEVASIKENRSGDIRTTLMPYPNGTLSIENNTVRQLIRAAYGVWDYQLVALPGWADQRHYDITAKATGPATRAQLMLMLQQLLEDRFALMLRHDQREQSIFALVQVEPGRLGPKLTPAKPEDEAGHLFPIRGVPRSGMTGQAATMADLADLLSNVQGRRVVDKTGLTGKYNFTLDTGDGRGPGAGPVVPPQQALGQLRDDAPAVATALREQLGLRLEAQRAPVDVLVIEHVQPLTE